MSRSSSIPNPFSQMLANHNVENYMRGRTFSSISEYIDKRNKAQQFFNEHPNWIEEDPVLRHVDRKLACGLGPNWRNDFSPDGHVNLKFVENTLSHMNVPIR